MFFSTCDIAITPSDKRSMTREMNWIQSVPLGKEEETFRVSNSDVYEAENVRI